MNIQAPPKHPALSLPVQAQAHVEMDPVRDERGNLFTPPSPAEQLQAVPVNFFGVVGRDSDDLCPELQSLAPHTLYMGTTGSGKTLAMKLHMASVLPSDHPNEYAMAFRSLVYDAKTDLLPFMARLGFAPDRNIILTNPFDTRSVAWDVFEDIDNPAASQAFAEIFCEEQGGEKFWTVAAREMVAACIDGLNAHTDSEGRRVFWSLRHLVSILDNPTLLAQVLDRTEKGKGVARDYMSASDRLSDSLKATLRSYVSHYRLIAALWDHATHSFSMERWARGGGMLLIGDHYRYRESMVRVNNLLVRYAIDVLMDRPGEEHLDLTWLYLDELKNAGRFPNFGTMLTQGRSKGIRAVLAAQGVSTLKLTFRENEEQEVLNNCGNKCIMQVASDEDARWAERLFSTVERSRITFNIPDDARSFGSRSITTADEPFIHAREFLQLSSANDFDGQLSAFYHATGAVVSYTEVPPRIVDSSMPPPGSRAALPAEFQPRSKATYALRPLTQADLEHLGLTDAPSKPEGDGGDDFTFRLHRPQ